MFLKLLNAASPSSRFFVRQMVLLAYDVSVADQFRELYESKRYQSVLKRFEKVDQSPAQKAERGEELLELIRAHAKKHHITEVT